MVWHLLMCMYVVNRESVGTSSFVKAITTTVLLIYAIVFSAIHMILKTTTAFQVHFGVLLGLVLARFYGRFRYTDAGSSGRQVVGLFCASGLSGFAFWLLDYHHCDWVQTWPINPHGHVLWHLLMGYAAYCSVVMLKVLEDAQGGKKTDIRYRFGLPFAHRLKNVEADCDTIKSDIESNQLF